MKCPCQGCEDRNPGCHSSCEKYKAWKAENEALKAKNTNSSAAQAVLSHGAQRFAVRKIINRSSKKQ